MLAVNHFPEVLPSIQGTVTDSEGAAIPNAAVTVTNDATGVSISRQTNGEGLYTVSPILPGTYTVRVKSQGSREVGFSATSHRMTMPASHWLERCSTFMLFQYWTCS